MFLKVKDAIKFGFGVTIGYYIADCLQYVVLGALRATTRNIVNDEEYMNGLKDRNPDLYEKCKKYQTK